MELWCGNGGDGAVKMKVKAKGEKNNRKKKNKVKVEKKNIKKRFAMSLLGLTELKFIYKERLK